MVDDLLDLSRSDLSLDALNAIDDALDQLIGNNGGSANNGVLDKLEQGNLNAALTKLRQVLQALEAAEAAAVNLDLSAAKAQLTLAARSVAVDIIAQASAVATKQNEFRKIEDAEELVDTGDTALAISDYASALDAYRSAVQKVQNIVK